MNNFVNRHAREWRYELGNGQWTLKNGQQLADAEQR